MTNRIVAALLSIIFLFNAFKMPVEAAVIDFGAFPEDLIAGYATAYEIDGITASGEPTRQGICASSSDRIGCIILLYQRLPDNSVGKFIGQWDCLDTGGTDGIKNGTVIDVWEPTRFDSLEFMDLVYENGCQGKVWIQVIKGEG